MTDQAVLHVYLLGSLFGLSLWWFLSRLSKSDEPVGDGDDPT